MASLTSDARGKRRILFRDGDDRRTIHLGDVEKKIAAGVLSHVERLINAKHFAQPLPVETARWLATVKPELHARLVKAKLAEPRHAPPAVTLADVADTFTTQRGESVKPGTKIVWAQARRHLVKYFTEAKSAGEITPADADDFRRKLRSDYSEAYTAKMIMVSKAFFRDAARRKMIDASPFTEVANGSQRNPDRQRFVDAATIQKCIDAAPDAEWRLLIALARFGGLRVPSEPQALRWEDVNWAEGTMTVRSVKTERHAGGAARVVPIFPELRPLLMEAFESAADGEPNVITRWRTSAVNLRTGFERIITRAGVTPWPRLWQNLRASRATELIDSFPSHVCAAWLGHTDAVADRHYRQVTSAHVATAIAGTPTDSNSGMDSNTAAEGPTQNPTQQTTPMARIGRKGVGADIQKPMVFQPIAAACEAVPEPGWAMRDSNPRHPRCKRGALAAELIAR